MRSRYSEIKILQIDTNFRSYPGDPQQKQPPARVTGTEHAFVGEKKRAENIKWVDIDLNFG